MQFCKSCGGALNLFETNVDKVCWSCVREKEKQQPPPSRQPEADELAETRLCYEENKLILKAPEGWVLWSGATDKEYDLGAIMERARRILTIRRKRVKATT